jgi:Tol biopolymer transport system component
VLDTAGGVDVHEIPPLTITDQLVSAHGWIACRDDSGQLVLENILSSQRETITVEGSFYFARMRWSPDGRYLLAQGGDRGLYLVDTTDFTVTLIAERASLETQSVYSWQVEYWSPGGDYVVFVSQSADTPTISYLYLYG